MGEVLSGQIANEKVMVRSHPSEMLLNALVILISASIWFGLIVTIVGAVCAALLGLFFFLSHLIVIATIRGSGVRIGPVQYPQLHERIVALSTSAGLRHSPDAYVVQAGGTLNAMATRFLRARMVILYSDLLDACERDDEARDMIIGHELGHIACGHLEWAWFLLPGMFVPFLGSAYSRAREYTCDRYGAALSGNGSGTLRGLTVLAAGRRLGRTVNLEAFAAQQQELDTGAMTLGRWLSPHPPLCARVAALKPDLVQGLRLGKGPRRLLAALVVLFVIVPAIVVMLAISALKGLVGKFTDSLSRVEHRQETVLTVEETSAKVQRDFEQLVKVVNAYRVEHGSLPVAANGTLSAVWKLYDPADAEPLDPFDGSPYGYSISGDSFLLWSSGPDGKSGTDDDIVYRSLE